MNSLSWLIYGAEVVGNLRATATVLVPVGLIGGAATAFIGAMMTASRIDAATEELGSKVRSYAKPLLSWDSLGHSGLRYFLPKIA